MKPKLIIFTTARCSACKPFIAQVLAAIKEADIEDDIEIDIAVPTPDKTFGVLVESVPTTIIYKDDVVAYFRGVTSPQKIVDELMSILYAES